MTARFALPFSLRARTCGTVLLALTTLAPMAARAQTVSDEKPRAILTSSDQRCLYLAKATLWLERDLPSPAEIIQGPPGARAGGATREQYNPADGIPCTFESGGAAMGGKTPKFTCRTADGRSIRVKYYSGDPGSGNREVFAEVVGTRLFWALGFGADTVPTITVNCQDCPADPMNGTGPRKARKSIGEAGRTLLADLLARLTDAHIRAFFEAGRVEALGEQHVWTDANAGTTYRGLDAWVAVFKQKRDAITTARCGGTAPAPSNH